MSNLESKGLLLLCLKIGGKKKFHVQKKYLYTDSVGKHGAQEGETEGSDNMVSLL